MNQHIIILLEAVDRLLIQVNAIDRVIPEMKSSYPTWDLTDTTQFRDSVVASLHLAIERLNQI